MALTDDDKKKKKSSVKRVNKATVITGTTPNSTSATQTKTVLRNDRSTPRKTIVTDYTNTYDKKGRTGASDISKITKTRFDKSGKPKAIITKTPFLKKGGSVKSKMKINNTKKK